MAIIMLRKRFTAVFIALSIICASLCVTIGVYRRQKREFTPRFQAPLRSEGCYFENNIFYQSGFGIPNCTAYAWGRAYELLGEEPRLCTSDAREWFSYNKRTGAYDYGDEPRLGAIACFDNEYGGHVAVVENIDDGVITFSNSAYMGSEFYLSTASVNDNSAGQKDWSFQGYIYLSDFDEKELSINSNRRISAVDGLNLREYPSTQAEIIDTIPEKSQVYITKVVKCGEYFWGKASFGKKSGYCVIDYTEYSL